MTTAAMVAVLKKRPVPAGIRAEPLIFAPRSHTPTTVSYELRVPYSGTLLGVLLPREWPRTCLVTEFRWDQGETVVVQNTSGGFLPPAHALAGVRCWARTAQCLLLTLSVNPTSGVTAPYLAASPAARPVTVIVRPAENGLARMVRWLQGGRL
jgi:hypothetical protein